MPRIISSLAPLTGTGGTIGREGKLWWFPPEVTSLAAATDLHEILLPTGTNGVLQRPCWSTYNNLSRSRMYGAGAWTAGILIDEHLRCLRSGIPPPNLVPSITAGAGTLSGLMIPYLRFLDFDGQRVSPLSAAGATLNLTSQGRTWPNLPISSPDPSVSHLQGLVSVDGALPRVAWTRQLGVASLTESVATLALGEAHPDPDFTSMPLGQFGLMFNDAYWLFGNEQFPERGFRSALGEPERYEGTFAQSDGEPILGAFECNHNLFFGGKQRVYVVTGYTDFDITREVAKPDIGLINFHGIRNFHGYVIIPTTVGFFLYNGTWNNLQGDREKEWAREYKLYRPQYERAGSVWDSTRRVYKFGPVPHSEIFSATPGDLSVYWVLNGDRLVPELEAGGYRADWSNDARAREDTTSCVFTFPGSAQGLTVVGSTDGHLRAENVEEDPDDNGDVYQKKLVIEPATVRPKALAGISSEGYRFDLAWNYMEGPFTAWTAHFRAGGPNCRERQNPDFEDITGSLHIDDVEEDHKEHHWLEDTAGDCLNNRLSVTGPTFLRWCGWGAIYVPGVTARGFTFVAGGA